MIKRSEKVAFLGVGTGDAMKYMRMTDFTELSTSKNAQEYTRKYVDEDKERTSVTGYAVSLSYKFDYDPSNEVHKALCSCLEEVVNFIDFGSCKYTITEDGEFDIPDKSLYVKVQL